MAGTLFKWNLRCRGYGESRGQIILFSTHRHIIYGASTSSMLFTVDMFKIIRVGGLKSRGETRCIVVKIEVNWLRGYHITHAKIEEA